MKKTIKVYVTLIIFSFGTMLVSCTENPVDKKISELEAFVKRMDNLAQEETPSRDQIIKLNNDLRMFRESALLSPMNDAKLTESQKTRVFGIMTKFQKMQYNPNYQRLEKFVRLYHLNY